jgi:hypothetical protein
MASCLRLIAIASSVAAFVACSHDLESPQPSLATVAPDLVCNGASVSTADGHSTVTVHGDHFTPMPSRTLEGPTRLLLPRVTLSPVAALPGGTLAGAPIEIADDAAAPAASRVHWASERELGFDVLPADGLAEGVFDLTITNPDGTSAATLARRLAILPPPIVAMIIPPAICDDQEDQDVVITGANFLAYGDQTPSVTVGAGALLHTYAARVADADCQAVDGAFDETGVRLCSALTITIPQGDFMVTSATELAVVVTNPAPADCASSTSPVTITLNPPPRVDSVIPGTVCQGGSTLTVNGANFQADAAVTLDCDTVAIQAAAVTVVPDGTQLVATFAGGAMPGTSCQVIVVNPDGCEDRPLPHKTVSVVPGPVVFFVDPEVVYNRINTRITVYATTITQPLAANAVRIVPTGQAAPVTDLAFNPVAGHPNRLQAIVPAGQPVGVYDLLLSDNTGCGSVLPEAITVTDTSTVTLKGVSPPFGATASDTSIQIFRDTAAPAPGNAPFVETPRVYLNPTSPAATDVAVEVESVAFLDGDRVTGVVPAGTPVHAYDVVLVNPDGTVGVLPYSVAGGYASTGAPPPEITGATPASIVAATGQRVTLTGRNFAPGDIVTHACRDAAGAALPSPPVVAAAAVCNGADCAQAITIDASVLTMGAVCVVRVTNPDTTFGELSAIGVTNSSLNLNPPQPGPLMNVGRRGLVAAAGNATATNRFVYAIGGDDGDLANPLASVELAPVDPFGRIGAFTIQPYDLDGARTLAAGVAIGRYLSVIGGRGNEGAVHGASRALILSPRETPRINDVDVALRPVGLEAGRYHYRVSAVFADADTDNPGGESLASDELTVRVPSFAGSKVALTLVWRAPVDALGMPVPGVVGYRVYRTALAGDAPGTEVLLGDAAITTAQTVFTDDGTRAPTTTRPLPLGSTGRWASLPALATAREGLAVTWAPDPLDASKLYVYALLGRASAAVTNRSYEYLAVTVGVNGRQTAAAAWTAGTQQTSVGRWQLGAWSVDRSVSTDVPAGVRYLYAGGGQTAAGAGETTVEAAQVTAGGQLGAWNDAGVQNFGASTSGYGTCAANGQLFTFGGQQGAPSKGAKSAVIGAAPPAFAPGAWNDEGLSMTRGRYLLGSAVQSAFIFLLGGQTDEPSAASRTTELVIW